VATNDPPLTPLSDKEMDVVKKRHAILRETQECLHRLFLELAERHHLTHHEAQAITQGLLLAQQKDVFADALNEITKEHE
jgi:hypothetical protein